MSFNVGDKVLFGRSHGEKTAGTVVKVNRAKYKIRQDEARGTMRDYPVGTIWTVPFNLAWPATGTVSTPAPTMTFVPLATEVTNLLVKSPFKIGDRVRFAGRRGVEVTGTVKSINIKSVTVVDCSDGSRGWRVHPKMLALSTAAAPAPAPKRGEDAIMGDILGVYSALSPENLHCDGEISRSAANAKAVILNRKLRALETELGRRVNEAEAYRWYDAKNPRRATAAR